MTLQAPVPIEKSPTQKKPELRARRPAKRRGRLSSFRRQLLMIDAIRASVVWLRMLYYAKLRRRYEAAPLTADVGASTVAHNRKAVALRQSLRDQLRNFSVSRSNRLIRPLSVLTPTGLGVPDLDVLSIGPRSEGEILNLLAHGYARERIEAIDLFTHTPWIRAADMHAMPYGANSFDVIVCGWVLAYSENKRKAAAEIVRVARDGALLAIGVAYDPRTPDEVAAAVGYLPGSRELLRSVPDILALFGDHVGNVHLSRDVAPRDKPQDILVVFSIKKEALP